MDSASTRRRSDWERASTTPSRTSPRRTAPPPRSPASAEGRRKRAASGPGRARVAPHQPQSGSPRGADLAGDLEAVAPVEGDVAGLGGLEIGGHTLLVEAG